jgi:hypothetical protein
MTTFATMLNRFETFSPTLAAGEAIEAKQEEVLDINREQLYEKGENKYGQPLTSYTPSYAKKKEKMRGKRIVDIYLTGKLQEEMKIEVKGDVYEISSPAPYAPYVLNKRPDLFGFTPDGKKVVWHIIRPDFVTKLAEATGCIKN